MPHTSPSPTAQTSHGALAGLVEDAVLSFRAVPFAAPPVGELRFRSPQPPLPWKGVRDATQPPPAALQLPSAYAALVMHGLQPGKEDCLYLNVWTPSTTGSRPVMVWFHGGAFVSGSGWQTMFNGAALAARGDVVVVGVNYRLGVFGFLHGRSLCGEELDATGNEGLLDQVAALEWVRSEIAAFGGDPGNVTAFGASAGAGSIALLLSSGRAPGLVRRAIMQSGSVNLHTTPERASAVASAILADRGLSPANAHLLRELPAEALLEAQARATPRTGAGPPYMPVADGELVPLDPVAAIASGAAAGIDVMVGTNLHEMRFYGLTDPGMLACTEEDLLDRLARALRSEPRAREVIALYRDARASRGEPASPADILQQVNGDLTFRLPAIRFAEAQGRHTPNVFAYLFTWESPWEGGRLGACHSLEGGFVFGTVDRPGVSQVTGSGPAAARLSGAMMDAWAAFARTGNPSHGGLPAWPAYEPARRATMRLGQSCELLEAPMEPERAAWP